MFLGVDPVQLAIVVAAAVAVAYVWSADGRGRWYAVLSERFIYGVPWGTLLSIAAVVAFYLFAQSGLSHWSSPATLPFRSWSYGYPLGLLSAGFAHAGPDHLIGNMVGTVVFAPLVEYAWSHYPPRRSADEDGFRFPPPGERRDSWGPDGYETPAQPRLRERPWVRALVIFPAVVLAVSILTSLLALGWSLGFSGTVFAFAGFAVVYTPLAAVVATVGLGGVGAVVAALRDPVLRVSTDPGAPGPPSWAGINVQAHLLGLLIGVLLAFALLWYRDQRRSAGPVFLAVAAFAFAQRLWSIPVSGDGEYLQLRGIGVVFVLALTLLITATVTNEAPASSRLSAATPSLGPSMPVTTQRLLVVGLVLVTGVVALPSAASNGFPMDDDPLPDTAAIEIDDYHVTYAEDTPHGRVTGNESGVIVVSERRDVWLSVVDKNQLAHSGEATVVVGGVGWREEVTANRTGWDVTGGETAYAVDLAHDSERIRAFRSDAAEADVTIANQTVAVVPDDDQFRLNVSRDGVAIGDVAVPAINETATVGSLRFLTEPGADGDDVTVYAERDGTRVQIATREQF